MSKSEQLLESREQVETKIVQINWAYNNSILEVPIDWNLDQYLEEYKKDQNISDKHLAVQQGAEFLNWLEEKGAKKASVEYFGM